MHKIFNIIKSSEEHPFKESKIEKKIKILHYVPVARKGNMIIIEFKLYSSQTFITF